jgi:hypothetical protein
MAKSGRESSRKKLAGRVPLRLGVSNSTAPATTEIPEAAPPADLVMVDAEDLLHVRAEAPTGFRKAAFLYPAPSELAAVQGGTGIGAPVRPDADRQDSCCAPLALELGEQLRSRIETDVDLRAGPILQPGGHLPIAEDVQEELIIGSERLPEKLRRTPPSVGSDRLYARKLRAIQMNVIHSKDQGEAV